jgi:hypothetical protein
LVTPAAKPRLLLTWSQAASQDGSIDFMVPLQPWSTERTQFTLVLDEAWSFP